MTFWERLAAWWRGQPKGAAARLRDKLQQDKQSPHGRSQFAGLFLTSLDLRALDGRDEWLVITPLEFRLSQVLLEKGPPGCAEVLVVPKGFVTDLASVPQLLRAVISGVRETRKPAVLHDYLYRHRIGARAWADAVFLEAMVATRTGFAKRWACWLAVRIGGWFYR